VALTAICSVISSPLFSLKHPETFQIAAVLPVPQPSTLVGALAYCIGVEKGIGLNALNVARENIVLARAKLISDVSIISPVILRRFRVLDKGFERKQSKEVAAYNRAIDALLSRNISEYRRIVEQILSDAMYREYLTQVRFQCIWVIRDNIDHRIAYYIQRLGDTESLVTVNEVWQEDCIMEKVDTLSTEYPFTLDPNLINRFTGSYIITKMCDESRSIKTYIIPCKRDVLTTKDGVKVFSYTPSKVDINLKKIINVYRIGNEYIL